MRNRAVFHPDLRLGRFIPGVSYGPRSTRLMRRLTARPADLGLGVVAEELVVPGPEGAPPVSLRVLRPVGVTGPMPALLWVHGGGLIMGSPEQDDRANAAFVRELGITVAAVRYRLAPDSTAPAAAEDAYAGLLGLVAHADRLGLDPARIAVGGASAGGGVAAAAVLMAHDRAGGRPASQPPMAQLPAPRPRTAHLPTASLPVAHLPAFQLLVYPMLDDRTVVRTDLDTRQVRVWTPKSNRFGWTAYLGRAPGGPDVPPYAAPARREDLHGLPPTWIGVGSLDLFRDEDETYARRLREAGVACELKIVPGAFHGFDAIFRNAGVSREFWRAQADALRSVLLT